MDYQYDVALSFAGEDRAYVEQVARSLEAAGARVFYDRFEKVTLWGENLVDHLDRVYRTQSRYAVVFISRHYISKAWPRHERQSAQARALVESKPYILPVRFDDAELPGLPPTISYLDVREIKPSELANLIMAKLDRSSDDGPPLSNALAWDGEVPPDPDMIASEKPLGWEYMLLAAVIAQGMVQLRPKRRRFEMGMATPLGQRLSAKEADARLSGEFDSLLRLVQVGEQVMGGYLQDALGDPGIAGDADMIKSAANSLVEVYEGVLDWAERIRSYNVPTAMYEVADLQAQYITGTLRAFDDFSSRLVAIARDLPELLSQRRDEPLVLPVVWKPTIDKEVQKRHGRALKRARRRLRI